MKITKVRAFLLSSSIGIMVISAGVALGETSDISTNSASSPLQGQIFQVEGTNSDGSTFTTCYRWRRNTLTVDRLPGRLRYAFIGRLGFPDFPSRRLNFQAVRQTRVFLNGQFVTLAGLGMSGSYSSRERTISGQGIRENGRTFTFTGRTNPNCQLGGLSTLQEIPTEEPDDDIPPGNEPPDPAPAVDEPTPPF